MASMLVLALGGAVSATAIVGYAAGGYVLERRRVNRTLRQMPQGELTADNVRERALAAPVTERILVPGLRRAGRRLRRFAPAGALERISHHLAAAGSPAAWDAERVFAAKVVAGGGLFCAVLALGLARGTPAVRALLFAAVAAIVGYLAPEWVVRGRASERQGRIQRALPDSLDLLSITVQAGLGFDAAVDRVSQQTEGPFGEEMRRLLREMQLGKSRGAALRDLGDRNDVPELTSFVLAMVQADSFGIAISSVLEVQSREMRLKRRQRAQEKAHKVPIKILFPVLCCIFPSLFLVLLGPAVIQLYRALIA